MKRLIAMVLATAALAPALPAEDNNDLFRNAAAQIEKIKARMAAAQQQVAMLRQDLQRIKQELAETDDGPVREKLEEKMAVLQTQLVDAARRTEEMMVMEMELRMRLEKIRAGALDDLPEPVEPKVRDTYASMRDFVNAISVNLDMGAGDVRKQRIAARDRFIAKVFGKRTITLTGTLQEFDGGAEKFGIVFKGDGWSSRRVLLYSEAALTDDLKKSLAAAKGKDLTVSFVVSNLELHERREQEPAADGASVRIIKHLAVKVKDLKIKP